MPDDEELREPVRLLRPSFGGDGVMTTDYPPEWDDEPDWLVCPTCKGDGTIRRGEFDWTCPDCDGDGGHER